jgi:hypothetical protein
LCESNRVKRYSQGSSRTFNLSGPGSVGQLAEPTRGAAIRRR